MEMGTKVPKLLLLFILRMLSISTADLPTSVPTISRVVANVRQHLHANCVLLLHNPEKEFQVTFSTQFIKTMGDQTIPVIAAYLQQYQSFSKENRYLHVITDENNAIRQFLLQQSMTCKLSKTKLLIFLHDTKIMDFFEDMYIPIDSEILVANWMRDKKEVIFLTEVFHVHPEITLQQHKVAEWNTSTGDIVWTGDGYYERRRNFQNISIQAVTAIKKDKEGKLTGFYGEVWTVLEQQLNFRTDFVKAADGGSYGAVSENGTWNGMMGMLVRGEADVAVGGFAMTPERLQAVCFLAPMIEGSVTIYIQRPGLDTFSSSWLLAPFSTKLWVTLVVVIILLSLGLSACWNFGRHVNKRKDERSLHQSSWLYVFGSFSGQGQFEALQTASCRALYLTCYLTVLIVMVAYSTTFISFLAVKNEALPFSSFQGLLDDGTFRLGVLAKSATLNYFDNSNNSFMKTIYSRVIAPEKDNLPTTNMDGLLQICKRKRYAYLCPSLTANLLHPKIPCDIVSIPEAKIPASSTMVVNEQSPYRRIINYCVQRMRRFGILKRIREKTLSSKMTEIEDISHPSMRFATMAPLMIILSVGIIVAVSFLFMEIHKIRYHR